MQLEPAPTRESIAKDDGGFLMIGNGWRVWFAKLFDFLNSPTFSKLPIYADNAAATAAGLAAGRIYRTATGEVRVVI